MSNFTAYNIAFWAFYATDHPFIALLMVVLSFVHFFEDHE